MFLNYLAEVKELEPMLERDEARKLLLAGTQKKAPTKT